MLELALLGGVAAVGTVLIWGGSVWLEGAANALARYFRMPRVVQGAVIAAIGSSFPELASVVIAVLRYGDFELGIAAIVGSALFNVLVIPALAVLVRPGTLSTSRELVYKEAQFYMLSLAVLLITFSLAVIYVPVEGERLVGEVTRPIALVPLAVYGLYLFIQYQDTKDNQTTDPRPDVGVARQFGLLLAGLATILVGVEALVFAAVELGDAFGTPAFLWGFVVIAAGTSLPDAFISLRAARADRPAVSLGNVFGSNTFDLLVAIPAGVVIAGSTAVDYARAAPLFGVLVLATVVVFAAARTDFELTDREAAFMLALYLGVVGWIALEIFGVTALLL